VKRSKRAKQVKVTANGAGVVSHAGVGLLRETAEHAGLVEGISAALLDTYKGLPGHAPGRVFTDLAVAIADGADAVAGTAVLRDRGELYGPVASDPTIGRVLDRIDTAHLPKVTKARAAARERAWAAGAAPDGGGPLTIDMDATITLAHSEKENAAATWKKTFGFHPLLAFLDRGEVSGGEALAGLLRPGNAGSNTATDHVTVLDQALASLPSCWRPDSSSDPTTSAGPGVLVRTDAAGATHTFAKTCRARGVGFSFGFAVDERIRRVVDVIPDECWHPAVETAGCIRDGAWVAEITEAIDLSAWPAGTRLILRAERPHPGAQLNFLDVDGHRITALITDTAPGVVVGQVAGLELRHRQHARVEDRILLLGF
jgi:hypothetical protein